jgi:MGT family glycosyltransferase
MARIAITHCGLVGHVACGRRLGATLVGLGHEVHAWVPEAFRGGIESTGATVHPHEPLPAQSISGGGAGYVAQLAEATERAAGRLIEELLDCDPDLLVYDYHAPWGRLAADFLGLPRIAACPLVPGIGTGPRPGSNPETVRAESPVGEVNVATAGPPLVAAFPPGWERSVERAQASRAAILRRWGIPFTLAAEGPSDWAVSFTSPEFAGAGSVPDRWRFLGPLLDAAPAGPPGTAAPPGPLGPPVSQGTSSRPLVYVSLGTFFNFLRPVYERIIQALAGEPLDVLVSTGRGPVTPAHLSPLPENFAVRTFVDAREVLRRAAAMISHCGLNSVHEALVAGVPLLCLPQAMDQFGWARQVERFGAGRVVPPTVTAIRDGVRALTGDRRFRIRARDVGARLAAYDGAGEVARLVADVLD